MNLIISDISLKKSEAEKYLINISNDLKLPVYKSKDFTKQLTINHNEDKPTIINLSEELQYVIKNGKAKTLQIFYDQKDRFLNAPLSISIYTRSEGKPLKGSINTSYESHNGDVRFPGSIGAPELGLADDIVYYRKKAVEMYSEGHFEVFDRFFRSYLFASISIIDCFLYRYNFKIKNMGSNTEKYENTNILNSRLPLEERILAWMNTFAIHKIDELKKSAEWSKFKELKSKRNEIVHPSEPTISFSVMENVKLFNFAKDGIGGLLLNMRNYAEQRPYIGFIQQLFHVKDIRIS